MPRFAANLSLLYNELPFFERFAAAAADGFKGVEILFPYAYAPAQIAARLREHGLELVLLNAPPGEWDAGERGLACLPGRELEFRSNFVRALDYARALDCPRIHVMAGLAAAGAGPELLRPLYLDNLRWAAQQAAAAGRQILIEPINQRDMPGYFLARQDDAHAIVQTLAAPNLAVQMDLYHCQVSEGDVASKLRRYLPSGRVGHLQIAGVPERSEPDVGELHYPYLFALIDALAARHGWQGWVGCEYRPQRGAAARATSDGLGWIRPWV